MIHAAMEAGEPSYIKIFINNLVTCKSVRCDNHFIGRGVLY